MDSSENGQMIGAVVLAAGAATRFGAPKQRLLLASVLKRLRSAHSVDEIVVVLGAYEVATDARTVHCPDWKRGPGASLRCGFAALATDARAALIVLADGPNLSPKSVDRVVEAWQRTGVPLVAASYGGVRGHPVLLARTAWNEVPDEGARALAAELIPCDDLGPPGDIDYPSDLEHLGEISESV